MPSWASEPDNARAWRRLVGAVLLHAVEEAAAGDVEAAAFVLSEDARIMADDLDLPAWPPPREAWRRVRYLSWATERGAVEPITRPRLMRGRRRTGAPERPALR